MGIRSSSWVTVQGKGWVIPLLMPTFSMCAYVVLSGLILGLLYKISPKGMVAKIRSTVIEDRF